MSFKKKQDSKKVTSWDYLLSFFRSKNKDVIRYEEKVAKLQKDMKLVFLLWKIYVEITVYAKFKNNYAYLIQTADISRVYGEMVYHY